MKGSGRLSPPGRPRGERIISRILAIGGALVIALAVVVALLLLLEAPVDRPDLPDEAGAPARAPAEREKPERPASGVEQGFLYGRVTTGDGTAYVGRLRWGGSEEAFWGDYFNGMKRENPWAAHVPPERLEERSPVAVFGVEIARRVGRIELERPFMTRFGDIARIDPHGRDLQVTLKSGTVFHLDRYEADDLADGLRVWDRERGVVEIGERQIRTVEFLATAPLADVPDRLHGTVRASHGEFTGFLQWNREKGVGTDELNGRTANTKVAVRFDTIRVITRTPRGDARVTLDGGRELVLSGTPETGRGHRGVYVDDARFGRVLVPWSAFERVEFVPGGSGPAYDDFPPGQPLTGRVSARGGRRLAGRIVFDLDESETTETLDAPSGGVHYTILFGLIASIEPASGTAPDSGRATITLHGGTELRLEPRGDLAPGNAGLLIFVAGAERAEYLPWADVERIDLDRPAAMYPALVGG